MFTFTPNQAKKNNYRFGGNALAVYRRDNGACVSCGMTNEQHKTRYKKNLTINHIDGSGRVKNPKRGTLETKLSVNNSLDNLETLCLKCHGIKDGVRTKSNQWGAF